jgi:hypothetical protein
VDSHSNTRMAEELFQSKQIDETALVALRMCAEDRGSESTELSENLLALIGLAWLIPTSSLVRLQASVVFNLCHRSI